MVTLLLIGLVAGAAYWYIRIGYPKYLAPSKPVEQDGLALTVNSIAIVVLLYGLIQLIV